VSGVYSFPGEENSLRGKGFSLRREGDILRKRKEAIGKSKKASGKNKKPMGKTFTQADIQSAAKAVETRSIGVKRGLMDIGVRSVFFRSDAMYFTDKLSFIHKYAPLIACLLYRRFPVHISLYSDAGHLYGLICKCIKGYYYKGASGKPSN